MTFLEALKVTTERIKTWAEGKFLNKSNIDSTLSTTSENPVQNKVVNAEISSLKTLVGNTAVDEQISVAMAAKADASHTHTASEVGADVAGAANTALQSAKEYADAAANAVKNDLLSGAGDAYNTLKELGDLIDDNTDAIKALETIASGKANATHAHTISDVTNLQTTLNGKAASSHTHTVANISDLTATATELNYMDGVTSNVQTQLNAKAASSHNHAASSITSGTLSSDRLPTIPITKGGTGATTAADALTNLGIKATVAELNIMDGVTATTAELNYVDGVTSNIQTQLNEKAASSHTHSYAGSSSAGGAATSANKLNTNAGGTTQPVYFANGVPVKTTYTLGASVPSGAKFTDTTYSVATTSANGLMSSADKTKLNGIATGANKITVDSALSSTSTNPVQNKIVNNAISAIRQLPVVTTADNGKVLMVVNGAWAVVDLNLSVDTNGVLSI